MTELFAADWLDLREPYDRGARSGDLLERLAAWRAGRESLRVVDLGAVSYTHLTLPTM